MVLDKSLLMEFLLAGVESLAAAGPVSAVSADAEGPFSAPPSPAAPG